VNRRGQIAEAAGRTDGQHFHPSVGEVLGVASQAERSSVMADKITKADSLHDPSDVPAFGLMMHTLFSQVTDCMGMAFPVHRPRRLRGSENIRTLVRETRLEASQFILPLFVCPGQGVRKEIKSMPGNAQLSVDKLVDEGRECASLGIGGVILFGIPEHKDELASGAYDSDGITQRAVRALKREVPKLLVITDVCNCEYTSHGHCGWIQDGDVDNDITLEWLAKTAVSHAMAGADIVAPSDMMDGRVAAIRSALDEAGYLKTPILSYAAKYASAFYGPFREAAESAPQFGDRRSYQMDTANSREAMREIQLDLEEGADMIIVKPAMPYLDVIHAARERFDVPIGAYQVSGEFSMIMAAAQNGWLDLDRTILESLTSIRRAGADFVLTYFAKQAARLLG
jgi:porphobilinogen synthase